jgi:hypothetical protein
MEILYFLLCLVSFPGRRISRQFENLILLGYRILVEIFTIWKFFPETHNRTLEELSFMFEGKEMQDRVQQKVDKVLHQDYDNELQPVNTNPEQQQTRL